MVWVFGCKGQSGFSAKSTAEEVTAGIDGTGLTAIITGPTSGIGQESARVLALRVVHVIMAARNVDSGNKVKQSFMKEIPIAKVDVRELDVSSLKFHSRIHFLWSPFEHPHSECRHIGSSVYAY